MARITKLSGLVCFVALGALLGCSSDKGATGLTRPAVVSGATGSASVTAGFPSDAVKSTTNSVHAWILSGGDAASVCNQLIGGSLDPYDPVFDLRGDGVSKDPTAAAALAGVGSGKAVVYVEAVDYGGNVEYAGCQAIDVEGSTTATVPLQRAHVYDCALPGAKDGSPCDDGKLCTVGETCKAGVCQLGSARKCTVISDDCSGAKCDETNGCVAAVADDGTACDDHLACTGNDACVSGKCVGKTKDCAAEAGPCRTAIGTCSESFGGCQYTTSDKYGATCDDGLFCTANDACDYSGQCHGQPRDCTNGGCSVGTCDEANKRCNSTALPTTASCSDGLNCTTGDKCDGLGNCVGKPVVCSSSCATCNEASYGQCNLYKPLNTPCSDGNECTTGDVCNGSGSCQYAAYTTLGTSCNDHNDCTTNDACDGSGYCQYGAYATSGATCNDHNDCTVGDACNGSGSCTSGSYATTDGVSCGAPCKVGGTCTTGYCSYSTYSPAGTSCDDGQTCTTGDQCNGSGTCVGTTTATCG